MSSQSRVKDNTTATAIASHCNYNNNDAGIISSNSCLTRQAASALTTTSSSTTATTATAKHLHKIITPTDPLVPQDHSATNMSSRSSSSNTQLQKRSAAHISSSTKNFLSDIFADDETTSTTDDVPQEIMAAATNTTPCYTGSPLRDNMNDTEQYEEPPSSKKARTSSFSRCSKSFIALADGAAVHEVSSPSVVVSPSPQTNKSVINVQELQDIAFPSLPEMQATVSTSTTASHPSISHLNLNLLTNMDAEETTTAPWETRGVITDGPSYGWFVSTDNDATDTSEDESSSDTKMFLPDTKPEDLLTLKAITAPSLNQEVEVQKALAADTVDDVLGDIF